jgi:signal transduction histidine kinase
MRARLDDRLHGMPERRWIERKPVVLSAAAALYVAVFALRATQAGANEAVGLLYVVPIALVALELGLVAGVAAAALALGLLGAWAAGAGVHLGALGLVTRGVAFLAIGGVAGRFSDRMREAHSRQARLLESGFALADLAERQELAATLARSAAELVGGRGARVSLSGQPPVEYGVMAGDGPEIAIEARGVRHGTLELAAAHRLQAEEHAALAILALQAAVSDDNRQLLDSERERAAMRARLQEAHQRLDVRATQLRELIAGQEAERQHVSHELHEQAAQTLAAVLLGLRALERDLGAELASDRFDVLRSHVDETMRSLRSLAVSLRPQTLQLGLRPALERLADDQHVQLAVDDSVQLGDEIDTTVYRVVEEALGASTGEQRSLSVAVAPDGEAITIRLDADGPLDADKLLLLSGRLELVRGTLSSTPTGLQAVIPLLGEPTFTR